MLPKDLGNLLALSPKYTKSLLDEEGRFAKTKDTIQAYRDFDLAIEMDKSDPDAWTSGLF